MYCSLWYLKGSNNYQSFQYWLDMDSVRDIQLSVSQQINV